MWRGWGWMEEEREAETGKRTGEGGSQGRRVAHAPRPAALGAWPQRPTWPFISLVSAYNQHPQSKGKHLWPGRCVSKDLSLPGSPRAF